MIYYNTANLLLLLEEEKLTATRYLPLEKAYHHLAAGWGASRTVPVWSLSALLPQGTSANVAEHDLGPLTPKDFWKKTDADTFRSGLSEYSWVTAATIHHWFNHIRVHLIVAWTLLVSPEMLPNTGDNTHISSVLTYTLACWGNKRIKIWQSFNRNYAPDYCGRYMLATGCGCFKEMSLILYEFFQFMCTYLSYVVIRYPSFPGGFFFPPRK